MDKRSWRLALKSLKVSNIQEKTFQLCESLKNFLKDQHGIWAAYQPLPDEAQITSAISQSQHLNWVYPKCTTQNEQAHMHFYSAEFGFEEGLYGISEPKTVTQHTPVSLEPVSLKDIQGVLVPALGFDRQGWRLGRGKGYYDRTFSQYKGMKVGVVLGECLVNELPRESHDLRMDWIVTDKEVLRI